MRPQYSIEEGGVLDREVLYVSALFYYFFFPQKELPYLLKPLFENIPIFLAKVKPCSFTRNVAVTETFYGIYFVFIFFPYQNIHLLHHKSVFFWRVGKLEL